MQIYLVGGPEIIQQAEGLDKKLKNTKKIIKYDVGHDRRILLFI